MHTAIDISSRKQAYIVFYEVSSASDGTAKSFYYPFVIADTTPSTAVNSKTQYTSKDIVIVYSLTTDGKSHSQELAIGDTKYCYLIE